MDDNNDFRQQVEGQQLESVDLLRNLSRGREEIELVREASRIEDIAAQYCELSKTGANFVGLCPLPSHSEKNASFNVYPESQSFFCYGCHKGGDVFNLVMNKEGISFSEALTQLAARANINLETKHSAEWEERRSVVDALTIATDYYHQSLLQDTPPAKLCRQYLNKRHVLPESIETLKIGFASGHGLLAYLKERGVTDSIAIKAGLMREDTGSLREFFYGRFIFPYLEGGKTVYLSGRATGGAKPKYLGLPGSKPLYRSTVRRGKPLLIVVEGPIDAILLAQWGYSVIALSGTALHQALVKQIAGYDSIRVCLDSDDGGRNGSVVLLEQLFPKVKAAKLPETIDDPADFVEKGHTKAEFDGLIANAKDFIEFSLEKFRPDTDKLELVDLLKPILEKLSELDDPAKTEAYLTHKLPTVLTSKRRN